MNDSIANIILDRAGRLCAPMLGWCAAVAMLLGAGAARAQQQPAAAENSQDEMVNIAAPEPDNQGKLTIFRSGDKSEVNHYISQVIELKNGMALEVLPHVLRAVALEKGNARVLEYTPPDGGAAHQYIQVITTVEQMPSVVSTIQALDLPDVKSSTGVVRYSLRTRNRRASEVAGVLKGTVLSAEGKVYADDITNTLFIEDSHSDGKNDLSQVEFYDVPPPQIEFDIQLIETRDDDASKLGLDWQAWKRSLGGQIESVGNVYESAATFSRLDWLLTLDAPALAQFLNYAGQRGDAKIVQRAHIAGNNQQPAVLRNARRVPNYDYVRTDRTPAVVTEKNPAADAGTDGAPGGDRTAAIVPPSQFRSVDLGNDEEGISVSILPFIGTDMVTAQICVNASTLSGFDEQDHPILTRQDFNTNISLKDMQTLRLGTIEKESTIGYRRGIPGLRDVPVLGKLFGVEGRRKEKSQIHIIATPCYCNVTVYQARMKDAPGPVLKMNEVKLPEYIKLDMLPLDRE